MSNPVVIHSKLSFSGRERWRKCPISVHMSEGMPNSSGPAAAEGTCAHTVAEFYVRQRFLLPGHADGEAPMQAVPPGLELGDTTPEEWNERMREHGRAYAGFIREQIAEHGAHLSEAFVMLEYKVSIPSIHPLLFGTADCIVWIPRLRLLIVIDYKYGFVHVDIGTPDDTNPQIGAYLVAAAEVLPEPPLAFRAAVFQPRLPGAAQKPLDLPGEWLTRERRKLMDETAAVENPGAPRPGDHCRYCKGATKCPATRDALQTAIQAHCGEVDLASMGEDLIVQLWAARTAFKAFWEDVDERVEKMVAGGSKHFTVKVSEGRQMWADPKNAALYLLAMNRTDLLAPVAISEALPHLPAELRAALVKRSKGSRTITPVEPGTPHALAATFAKFAKKETA
jgi:hypothetical protein